MFIFERLVGVATYASILILVCLSLAMTKMVKHQKRILFLYTVILSVLAFFYVPYETADLYRINGFIERYGKHSFQSFMALYEEDSNMGLASILYWLIGQTGIPQLLPMIVSFICYSCIFYIIYKTAKINEISGKNSAITLFFYMSIGTYMFVISGIRSMLGISLLAFCFYRESAEKKFSLFHIPLYLISAFIHTFSAVLLTIRLFIPLFDMKTTLLKKITHSAFLGAIVVLALQYFGEYIEKITKKADEYLNGNMYSYVWDYIVGIIVCIVLLSIVFQFKRIETQSALKLNNMRSFLIFCFFIALYCCYEFSTFHRMVAYLLPIISLPMLMTLLQKNDNERKRVFNQSHRAILDVPFAYSVGMVFVSILLLFLSCTRGSLCSFKFFVL